jgi:hypothetical protein
MISTDHRFVNTTPKPNATKNRSGDDVGPVVPGLLVGDDIVVGDCDTDDRVFTIVDALLCARGDVGVTLGSMVLVCVPSTPRLWESRSST